jgi:hypothetical protein
MSDLHYLTCLDENCERAACVDRRANEPRVKQLFEHGAEIAALRAELETTRRELNSWKAEAQGRFKHYVGKTYELTQANMNRLILELEAASKERDAACEQLATFEQITLRLRAERDEAKALAKLDAAHFKFKFRQQTKGNARLANRSDMQTEMTINVMKERDRYRAALEHCSEHCLCERNTYGFDYGETHPKLGKPKQGSRWLTPSDIARAALAGGKETG